MRTTLLTKPVVRALLGVALLCSMSFDAAAKETPEQVRERQVEVKARVEASRKETRDHKDAQMKVSPCPLPAELKDQTADGWCASKGYIDIFNQPAKGLKCGAPARKAKDATWQFLSNYEMRGCNKPEGCPAFVCEGLYANSPFTRPVE